MKFILIPCLSLITFSTPLLFLHLPNLFKQTCYTENTFLSLADWADFPSAPILPQLKRLQKQSILRSADIRKPSITMCIQGMRNQFHPAYRVKKKERVKRENKRRQWNSWDGGGLSKKFWDEKCFVSVVAFSLVTSKLTFFISLQKYSNSWIYHNYKCHCLLLGHERIKRKKS